MLNYRNTTASSLTKQDFTYVASLHPYTRAIDESVAFPILFAGELEVIGWDIPIKVAVDSNHIYYMCNGHGGTLTKCSKGNIVYLVKQSNHVVDTKLLLLLDIKYSPSGLLGWTARLLGRLILSGSATPNWKLND